VTSRKGVQRLIQRVGKTDQAFRLGDGPAVQTSLNFSGWSQGRSDSAIKRSPSALAARVLDMLQVRRFLGRLDHPELILAAGDSVGLSRWPRQTMIRILFVFDPWRSAILLTSGDKTGQWNAWYERAIPHAEKLYAVYFEGAGRGGKSVSSFTKWTGGVYPHPFGPQSPGWPVP
jgi:hypothetical protein